MAYRNRNRRSNKRANKQRRKQNAQNELKIFAFRFGQVLGSVGTNSILNDKMEKGKESAERYRNYVPKEKKTLFGGKY